MVDDSYDRDIVAWASKQARHIRAGRLNELDLDHIADALGRFRPW